MYNNLTSINILGALLVIGLFFHKQLKLDFDYLLVTETTESIKVSFFFLVFMLSCKIQIPRCETSCLVSFSLLPSSHLLVPTKFAPSGIMCFMDLWI